MITAIIRTSGRPNAFRKCLQSLKEQSFEDWHIIVCSDNYADLRNYIEKECNSINAFRKIFVHIRPEERQLDHPYHWNLYFNRLMLLVVDGWFYFMDDDDYLQDTEALARIAPHLIDESKAVICQFRRGTRIKPSDLHIKNKVIEKGMIGGGCIFLHHTQKEVAQWDGFQAADYRFIRAVESRIPVLFVPVVVQQAGNAGLHGQKEWN